MSKATQTKTRAALVWPPSIPAKLLAHQPWPSWLLWPVASVVSSPLGPGRKMVDPHGNRRHSYMDPKPWHISNPWHTWPPIFKNRAHTHTHTSGGRRHPACLGLGMFELHAHLHILPGDELTPAGHVRSLQGLPHGASGWVASPWSRSRGSIRTLV